MENNINTDQPINVPSKPTNTFNNIESFDKQELNVKIIGIGGAGCNVISHICSNYPSIKEMATLYALNTDIGSLRVISQVPNKFLLNKEELKGFGSGGDPEVGKHAVEHDAEIIKQELANTDILFIVAGLGKGAGSGGAPELAKIAKEIGILTVSIVNMPSVACEGNIIFNNAFNALQSLTTYSTSVTTISNEKICSNKRDLSLFDAYSLANDEIVNIIEDILYIMFKPTKINIDFSDLKSFFNKNKFFLMNRVGFDANNISEQTVKNAISSKIRASYTDVDVNKAEKAIANINMAKSTPANFIHCINRALADYTKNSSISLVTGIEYNDGNSIDVSFIVAGNNHISDYASLNIQTEKAKWHSVDEDKVGNSTTAKDLEELISEIAEASIPTGQILEKK